ncbi:Serum response factor-binding protein 1 [Colletotrichum higginsianum]|uniref:Serum response factor-binding protein 1 n=1 Tax=Colletotrichum higginsianum TaxID=80884 RepID=A0A4T0WGH8_9PEZI|nr:Serum response factor-binding protein 1 [Colletotrichum higginsianum]
MMRDPRRRSPESSRRRRRERRDSREQLAAGSSVSSMPGPSAQFQPEPSQQPSQQPYHQQYQQHPLPHMYTQPQYPQPYPDPQRYPEPERYAARPETYHDPQRYGQPQPQPQPELQQYPPPGQYPPTEAFVNPLGYSEQQPHVEPQPNRGYREPETMRPRGGSSSSSSSSTSSSLLNISAKSPRFGGVFSTFFRAPSEQRKRRRRKKQKARILSFGNSSSSSLNSDLAYGRGYIERDKSQRASPTPQGYPNPALHHGDTAADIPQRPPPAPRDKTDEEILEIGRQLQDIARKQNQADLKAASKSRTSQIAGAATGAAVAAAAFSHLRPKSKSDSKTRGSGTSKPNETGSSSDDDWESASEDESTTDESDNGLVYGSAFKPAKSARISSEPPEQIKPPERRSTIVDPRLFGPVNSLRGAVKSPCGFGEEDPRSAGSSRRHHEETIAQVQSPKAFGKQPMQRIYPVPTSDPDKFDYDRSSVTSSRQDLSQRARPEPVPIQQPIPIVPVSSKVYDAERFEAEEERTKQHRLPPKGRSAAENAIAGVGVAAAAIGAAMASNRRDSGDYPEHRDDRSSEARERRGDPRDSWQSRRKEEPEQPIRIELEDRETHNHHDPRQPRRRDAVDVVDERDKRSGWSDPAYEALKRREAEPDPRSEVYRLSHGDEIRVEYDQTDDRSQPREEPKELPKNVRKPVAVDELRDAKWTEKPTESPRENHGVEQPEAPSTQAPIDPFQFQVADDAFQTPKYATPKRPLTPQVVTVDREPNFDDSPPRKPDYSDSRMSRKDSFELEQRLEKYQQGARDRSRTPEPRRRASIEEEAKHATVPIAVAAVASAIALEEERSRKHRHDQAANNGSRDSSQAAIKDAVQEEADKYYRETVIARKIAKDEIRSRSSSPHDESVVGKWQEHDDGPEIVTIVTPPEMDHHHDKSPYDAPNADVRIDHVIIPEELSRFRLPGHQLAPGEVPLFQTRDPSCERERPLLNLVLPTPVVTPRHTPAPEQQKDPRSSSRTRETTRQRSADPADAPSSDGAAPATEIVLGPRGEVIETPTAPIAKSVTRGENETDQFNSESPEPSRQVASSTPSKSKKKKKLGKSSPWGIISAAVGGGAAAAAVAAPEMRDPFERKPDENRERHSPPESPKSRGIEPVAEHIVLPASPKISTSFEDEHDLPPAPGPKPSSPQTSRMPGAFADDLEFASVLAAGLQDTGFDPNIVIDNPTYMRRDSPPGQSEPAVYQQPFAETVTDLGIYGPEGPPAPVERGFVIGEVPETPVVERDLEDAHATESPRVRERRDKGKAKETPLVEQEPSFEENELSRKPSKKERRKQKAAKRQSVDNAPADETYGIPEATSRPEPVPFSEAVPGYERPRSHYEIPGATPQDGPASFADPGPVYGRPHTYYGVPEPTPLSGPNPYSDTVSAYDRPRGYYETPEMTSQNGPAPFAETAPGYERPRGFFDTPQSPETVVALGSKTRGIQDVPTWDLPASSDVPRSYGETLAAAASTSETTPADYGSVAPSKSSKKEKKEKKRKSKSSRSEAIVVQEGEDELPNDERFPRDEPGASRKTLPEGDMSRFDEPQETGDYAREISVKEKQPKKSKQSSDEWTDVDKQSDFAPTVERSSTRDDFQDWDDLPPKSQRDRSRFEERDASSVVSDPSSRREKSDHRSRSSRHEDRDVSSVVSDPSSRRDKSERRSKSSRYEDRDVSSVASDPATRSEKLERRSKSIRSDERDTGSVVSDRSSRRSKPDRRSNGTRYEDGDDAKSVASASSSRKRQSGDQKSPKEEEKRSSGGFFNNLFRGGNSKDGSGKDDKSSFLDNAGTLGAGAGLASAVAALGSMMSRSNATEAQLQESADVVWPRGRSASPARDVDILDPEIAPRVIRPAIDPQYGDFLPLPPSPMPPSTPGSPTHELEELPALPDSRPETPPEERRRQHETKTPKTHARKRSNMETPTRSPSQTAVPFKLRLGQRSAPSSPGTFGASPVSSPTVSTAPDVAHTAHITPPTPAASHARRPSRPISWESSREIKPLYLLEQARQESAAQSLEPPFDLPELPPSEPSSRESPAPEFSLREDDVKYFHQLQDSPFEPDDLRIDTDMPQYREQPGRLFGSEETTPKAEHAVQHTGAMFERASPTLPGLPDAARQFDLSEHELEELPALPISPLASPTVPDVAGQPNLSQPDPEQLPALPDSPLDSPAMRLEAGPAETHYDERSLYGPASPALPTVADTSRQMDSAQPELDGLPALPASPITTPTTVVAEYPQQPDIPESKLEDLPALPDSLAASPNAMPEPEPVETTSKERSSYLLYSTPPSIIKNLMDRDTPDTPPSPTPIRSPGTTLVTPDVEEHVLPSPRNAAIGALVGGAAAGFAAASLIDRAEVDTEARDLETPAPEAPLEEEKKFKKDKKKKKKNRAKGASTDNAMPPLTDIASPVSTEDKDTVPSVDVANPASAKEAAAVSGEAARFLPTDEQETPLPLTEHTPPASIGQDESLPVDAGPISQTEDSALAAVKDATTLPVEAGPSAPVEAEVSSTESTVYDDLPPLPSVSADEEAFLSVDADLSAPVSESPVPWTQNTAPLELTDKVPRHVADLSGAPTGADQVTATDSLLAAGDISLVRNTTAEGEVAGPVAAELLAEDTAGGKKLSKKERKKLLKIKKAWEQAQAEMQELERSAESNGQYSKATSEVDAPLASLPEPDGDTGTNEAEEAAAVPLPDMSDSAEEALLLEPEETVETTQVEQIADTQLPNVLERSLEASLPESEEITKTAEAGQAAVTPPPEISEPAVEPLLEPYDNPEKAKDTQDEPGQSEPNPALEESDVAPEDSRTPLADSDRSKEVNEAELPAAPLIPEPPVPETKTSKKKKKKGKKAVEDEIPTTTPVPEAPAASSPADSPAPANDAKSSDGADDVQSEQKAPVVEQHDSLLDAEEPQQLQQHLATEVAEVKSSNVEDNFPISQLSLQASEEETVEPIKAPSEPETLPLDFVGKSLEPREILGEQQPAAHDQDDKPIEQDVTSSGLRSATPTQPASAKLEEDSLEQQNSAIEPTGTLGTVDSQPEQQVSVAKADQTTADEPRVESREVEEPTETSSVPLSKKQKKKLKKAKKSLTVDDELVATVDTKPTEPEPEPEPAADQRPSILHAEVKEADNFEVPPADIVTDATAAATPVEQAAEDVPVPVDIDADAAAVPLPEDATETTEEPPKEGPEQFASQQDAPAVPVPEDTPKAEEASEPVLAETVASAVPLPEDAVEEATATVTETSDTVPTVVNNGERPTSESAAPASVEAPPAESAQPEPSGKKKKKKKKGKGTSLSQLDDMLPAETTPLQSPGTQTPTTETTGDAPFGIQAPATDSQALKGPVVETPAVETPAVETPAVETPAVETPAVETPAVETPAVETPAVETPAVETPAVETPAVKTPAVETPSGKPLPIGADAVEATSTETPAAEPSALDIAIAETLVENPLADEPTTKTQPTEIVSADAQQSEEAILQATEPNPVIERTATTVLTPETPTTSSAVYGEQSETPALAEETSKASKKSKKKKKKDKKAAETEAEANAVVAGNGPTEPVDATSHNLPADEKPAEADTPLAQEPAAAVEEAKPSDANALDPAPEGTLSAESQTPTMTESQVEAFVTPSQAPALEIPTEISMSQLETVENPSQEPTLVDSQIDSFDAKPQEPLADEDKDRGLDSPIEPEASTSSKKSKKKAKKAAAAAAAAALELTVEDATKDTHDKEAKDETITDNGISKTILDKTGEMEQSSQEPPTSGEFATDSKISEEADPGPTVTKKGKKKKGKKSSTLDPEPGHGASTSTLETTADVANTREQSAYMTSPTGEPSSDEIPLSQADTPTEAEWPASATANKKKRKSVTWAPELESFSTSPDPPLLQEDEGPRDDLSTEEGASVPASASTPEETELQGAHDKTMGADSPEAISHDDGTASQGIDVGQQTATSIAEPEKVLESEGGQAQTYPAGEPSREALSSGLLQDTTPNARDDAPPSSGLKTTRGVTGELPPTPALSSTGVEVANRKGGETLSRVVDAEQQVSAEADATSDPEAAGRADTIDEPPAGASAQTGQVGIPDPGLHADVGPAGGLGDDESLADTRNGRIADAQPVGPALTDSALEEAGDPHGTPVVALADQDTNTAIPQPPLDPVPSHRPLEVGEISEAGVPDASTAAAAAAAENLLLGDEPHGKINISDVVTKEEAGDADKDEKEDNHDILATNAESPGQPDISESLGEPTTSEPQLEPLPETLPGPEPTGDVGTTTTTTIIPQTPDQTETQAGQEDDARSEPTSSSKMSKKDKKTKKKTKAGSAEPVPHDDAQHVKTQIVDDGAPAVQAVDEAVQASEEAGPDPSPDAPGAPGDPEVAPVTESVEACEDEWAVQPTSKKIKKDKKKRAAADIAATAAAAATTTEQGNEPATESSQVPIEPEAISQPALDETSKIDLVADQQPTPMPVDTAETPVDSLRSQEPKKNQETLGPAEEEAHSPPQPTSGIPHSSATTNEQPGEPEEAGAGVFETTKKSKKDKKKKKQSVSLDDSQEPTSPSAEQEGSSESQKGTTALAPPPDDNILPDTQQMTSGNDSASSKAAPEDLQKTLVQGESTLVSADAPATQQPTTAESTDALTAVESQAALGLPPDQVKDTGSTSQTEPELPGETFALPETPAAQEQTPQPVKESTSADTTPTIEPPFVPSDTPIFEEQISTSVDEEVSTPKKSKKDKKKKKKGAPVDTPEEQLPVMGEDAAPDSTTAPQAADTLEEPVLPAVEDAIQSTHAPIDETALPPETNQSQEEKPAEAESVQDPFAGLSQKQKKKKMAQMEKAAAAAAAAASAEADQIPAEETPSTDKLVENPFVEEPTGEEHIVENPVINEPVVEEAAKEEVAKEEPQPEPMPMPEQDPELRQVESDPFVGLSKKQKKKKMAEMAAAAEKAAAEKTIADADTKPIEKESVEEVLTTDAGKSKVVETPAEVDPARINTVENPPIEDNLADDQLIKEAPTPEAPQAEGEPFVGLGEAEATAVAATASKTAAVETTQVAEENPANKTIEDSAAEEKPSEAVVEDKSADGNVTEQPGSEPPTTQKDPFAGLSNKQRKKKMKEMAAAAAAAAAAATEAKEVVEEKPAENMTDVASAEQPPALENDSPSAPLVDVSREESVPDPVEEKEATQSAEATNPGVEFPALEKKSKKDKKKKGKLSQSESIVNPDPEQPSAEQQPEQPLVPEHQPEIPPTAQAEVEFIPIQTDQAAVAPSEELAGPEGTLANEKLPEVEEVMLDQPVGAVQPTDPEQTFHSTGKKAEKVEKMKRLGDLGDEIQSPTTTPPQVDEHAVVQPPSVEAVIADQTAVTQPDQLPIESQTRSVEVENQLNAPAAPDANAEDEFPLTDKKAKKVKKKKKGKTLDLTESDPLTEPAAPEVTQSVAEPNAETVAVPSPEKSLETSKSGEAVVEEPSSVVPDTQIDQSVNQSAPSEPVEQINNELSKNLPEQANADEAQPVDIATPADPPKFSDDDLSTLKLSKKDKKKKNKKTKVQDDSSPPSGTATPSVLEPSDPFIVSSLETQGILDTPAAVTSSEEPAEASRSPSKETSATQNDSVGAVAEETSSSGDLHSNKATLEERAPEPESSNSTTLPPGESDPPPLDNISVEHAPDQDADAIESAPPTTSQEPRQAAPEPVIAEPEEEFPTTTKKSKKDKKKKKSKSVDAMLVESEEPILPATSQEQIPADDVVEAKEAAVTDVDVSRAPAAAPTETSTENPVEVPVETSVEIPIVTSNDASFETRAESPNLDEELSSTQKKSKKDKRKKEKAQDDSEHNFDTASPTKVLDAVSDATQPSDAFFEPAEASRDANQPAVSSEPDPINSQDQLQAEPSAEQTLVTAESPAPPADATQNDEDVVVIEPQPPVGEEWPENTPTKKSKKDKKKNKKSKAGDDLDRGSGTATPLETTTEEVKEAISSKEISTAEEGQTFNDEVVSSTPTLEPMVAAPVPEASMQDSIQEAEEPRSLTWQTAQEQQVDEQRDVPTKSEPVTLEPERSTGEPVVVEEPQEFVVKKSKKDKKRKSALAGREPTHPAISPAIEDSSAGLENPITESVQDLGTAEPVTETPVIESTEDMAAPADERPETSTLKKSKKNKKKQSLLVEPEFVIESQVSSVTPETEPPTALPQHDQTAEADIPEPLLNANANAKPNTLTNEPDTAHSTEPAPVSEHESEVALESTSVQQPQIATADAAVETPSSVPLVDAQPTVESREVDEPAKLVVQEPIIETVPSDLPAEVPTTMADDWPEVATTKKKKKDKKNRKSLALDDGQAHPPLAPSTAAPQVDLAEEAILEADDHTTAEAPADETPAQPMDSSFEKPAVEKNTVTTKKHIEPLEPSELVSTSEKQDETRKIDVNSQQEPDELRATTKDIQVVEPIAQHVSGTFSSAESPTSYSPTERVVQDVQGSMTLDKAEDNFVVKKSKKDKKKKTKSANQALSDDPAVTVLETAEASEPLPVIGQAAPKTASEETSQESRGLDKVQQEPIGEDNESTRLFSADESATPLEDQIAPNIESTTESNEPPPEISTNVADVVTEDTARSSGEAGHQTPDAPTPQIASEPPAAGDDEWDTPVTKKSKKGKKGKKQNVSAELRAPVSAGLDLQRDSLVPEPEPELSKSEDAEEKTVYLGDASRDITRSPSALPAPEPAVVLESLAEVVPKPQPKPELEPEPVVTTLRSATSSKAVDIDLTPAQESSSIVHELPFNQPGKRKKMKTRALSDTLLSEPIVSSQETAAAYLDSSREVPAEKSSRATEQLPLRGLESDTRRDQDFAEPMAGKDAIQQNPIVSSPPGDVATPYLELKTDQKTGGLAQPRTPDRQHRPESSGTGVAVGAAAAAAVAGAVLASESSSAAKKKKGKKSKYEDKRARQDEDMFDDPSLWEGADRKHVSEVASAEVHDFWGGDGDGEAAAPEVAQKADDVFGPTTRGLGIHSSQPQDIAIQPAEPSTSSASRVLESSDAEGKNKSILSLAAPLKEKAQEDNVESPILGRETGTETAGVMAVDETQERSSSRGANPSGTHTMVSDMDEAVDRGFEAETRRDLSGGRSLKSPERTFEVSGFRSPVPTILPPVQEEAHEGGETEYRLLYRPASRTTLGSPDPTRDSGFVTGSPHPPSRRSGFDDNEQRDSGVHLREWQEQRSQDRDGRRTPELRIHRSERRRSRELERAKSPTDKTTSLQRSPFVEGAEARDHPLSKTPVLREPNGRELTPEPHKYRRTISPELERKRSKYQDLASAALAGAAISSTCSSPRSTPPPGNRSVSDRVARLQLPAPTQPVAARRSTSNSSLSRHRRAMGTPTPEPLKFRPDSPGIQRSATATPPLRRADRRVSGDLRSLSQRSQLDLTKDHQDPKDLTSSSSNTPVANEGRVRTKDMADVYDGFGEGRIGSPRSPTRPHSMRRRQSMQVLELESRVEQLMAENRMLADARSHTDSHNSNRASGILAERDAEIDVLKQSLEFLQKEVARLTEVNEGMNSANAQLAAQHNERYRSLETQHADTSRRLEEARTEQGHFQESLLQKDAEIGRLRSELEAAKDKIRQMQRQILATKGADSDFLNVRDVDHFDHRCQQLCSHVQQWVLRFSKFSDMRACRLTNEINDEKVIDRLDNAILDGTDVDTYLGDRVRRRDVFMSMTMNMIWEFVFTRYLFGMDREQRQKLKSLEKLLTEVGPPQAVRQWRAVTLTLLSKRPSFKHQRDLDTEAVVQAIFQTLSKVLPPPSNLEDQIQSQLRRVMREAVDLSIEMRTQRAEYMMLPPLQPEYDADGELADTVTFNAALMNERSADKAVTNEVLEAQNAVVRIVLFPLVVKKGDDGGNNDDEIVVCPAQVLVARPKGGKAVRLFTPGSDVGNASIGGQTAATHSDISMGTFLPEQASNR